MFEVRAYWQDTGGAFSVEGTFTTLEEAVTFCEGFDRSPELADLIPVEVTW